MTRHPELKNVNPPLTVHLDWYLCRRSNLGIFGAELDPYSYYPKDADNARAAFKAGQDALKDAGIVPSDSALVVLMGETRLHTREKQHQGRTCLVVTLEWEE